MKQDHHKTPNKITCRIPIKVIYQGCRPVAKQEYEQRLLQQHCRTNTRPNADLTHPVKPSQNGIETGPQIILQCKDSPAKPHT